MEPQTIGVPGVTGLVECEYTLSVQALSNSKQTWQSVDLLLRLKQGSNTERQKLPTKRDPKDPLDFNEFLSKCIDAAIAIGPSETIVIKFIVPLIAGTVIRSDIIPLRFSDCDLIQSAVSLVYSPAYTGTALSEAKDIEQLVSASAGALLLRQSRSRPDEIKDHNALSMLVEDELKNRLSIPWITSTKSPNQTLVLVEGGRSHPSHGGTAAEMYASAKALGIKIVVLDNAGHWIQSDSKYKHWCHAFVPIEMKDPPRSSFTDDIVAAVKAYGRPVHGLITFCDSYTEHVARAAKKLGLPAASPEGFGVASDKYRTSIAAKHNAFRGSSVEDALAIGRDSRTKYPLILKPVYGWCSEGVYRIDDFASLEAAVKGMAAGRHGNDFVIEPYCNGPEVDVNMVLLNGELLFFEVWDEPSKDGDLGGSGKEDQGSGATSFQEPNPVMPSQLPKEEIEILKSTFLDILKGLGLHTGVFHCEGRVDQSSVHYKLNDDGLMDLSSIEDNSQQAAAWLVEINPRPPGWKLCQIITDVWGIDYWGLAFLLAVRDETRARALSIPFANGPQYNCALVNIGNNYELTADMEGVFDGEEDPCSSLLKRRPDLARFVSRSECLVKPGQRVPHPIRDGLNEWIAYFYVVADTRRQALLIEQELRRELVKENCFKFR